MSKSDYYVRVVYGMGGDGPLSAGMKRFAVRLRGLGYPVHDQILWKYPGDIAVDFDRHAHGRIKVMIGYSMGATAITWVGNRLANPIDLAVAYDPSDGVPVVMPAPVERVNKKIKRCLHYKGWGIPVGGAKLEGPTVETTNTWIPHMLVDDAEWLHQMTLAAMKKLERDDHGTYEKGP